MTGPHSGYEGEPTSGTPYPSAEQGYPYGSPVGSSQGSGADIQPYGAAIQPYGAAAPASYAQPYPPAGVMGKELVSAGGRLGAALLDGLLLLCTFGIGWFIWAIITWSDGQTPAKKLLGHVVADADSGQPLDWGRMAVREFCIKGLLGWVLNLVTFSVYFLVDSFMIFGERQRTLHDRMASSIVRHI